MLSSSLIILEGHPTITKLPAIMAKLTSLRHPVYSSLSEYQNRGSGASSSSPSSSSSSDAITNNKQEFHFLAGSPYTNSLLKYQLSQSSQKDTIPIEIQNDAILKTKQWLNQQKQQFNDVKMVLLDADEYVAYRRIAYEWEWTGGEANEADRQRYNTEERMKTLWDSYYDKADQAQLWDLKVPSDDTRQCVWILLDKLGVEFEYKKFEQHFDPENKVDKDGKFRGAAFGQHDFL